ncbi:uncharacterized protein LOC110845337 isoform X1 [Folsomia candida]|uniref:Uncharacterized protein n=1 Tax=Folsomia candida TaxID=158441 RepID=A0A226ETV3_FOLCA|nr:uncharacterized protein LOC110845337 isoform X1 [Folsomia candida]OXA60251.1 hypothetical protein Fcan01_04146 [Folsomia candida]
MNRPIFPVFLTLLLIVSSSSEHKVSPRSDVIVEGITAYPSWYISEPTSSTTQTPTLYRIDGALYPAALIGPVTHGPDPEYTKDTTLRLNGQVYNIKESGRLGRGDSYLPGNGGDDGGLSDGDDDTTPVPVQGAIDYVLLPLIFLAIAGPMFVIVFIVMASVEYKLAPNVQLREERSLNNRKHTYFNLQTLYTEGAKPFMELVGRAFEDESCQERIACEMGSWSRGLREMSPGLFDYTEGFSRMLVPSRFSKSYDAYMTSIRKDGGYNNCLNFNFTCFTK